MAPVSSTTVIWCRMVSILRLQSGHMFTKVAEMEGKREKVMQVRKNLKQSMEKECEATRRTNTHIQVRGLCYVT